MSGCPVNFNPYDIKYADHIFEIYENLRNYEPIYWNDKDKFWIISRYEDVTTGLKDYKTFTSNYGITPITRIEYGNRPLNEFHIELKDPPDHTQDRRVLNRILNLLIDENFNKKIKLNITELLSEFRSGDDIVSKIFEVYPVRTVSNMLGLNENILYILKNEANKLFNLSNKIEQEESTIKIAKYIYKNPPAKLDKLKTIKIGDKNLSDFDVIKFSIILIIAGYETVTNALTNLLIDLDDNRDQLNLITLNKNLIPNAIEESLRLRRVAQSTMRTATRDVELHGRLIKEGDSVVFLNGAANTDSRYIINEPNKFLINRKYNKLNLSFSYGAHYCPGSELAKIQMKFFLQELIDKYKNFEIISKTKSIQSNLSGRYWESVIVNLGK